MSTRTAARALLVLALLLAACATSTPQHPASTAQTIPPEYAAAFEPYYQAGTASISGQAFLRTRGGEVVTAAGAEVTAEAGTLFTLGYMSKIDQRPNWPEANRARRTTRADAEGRFTIAGLPAGRWIIVSEIYWEIPRSTVVGVQLQRTGGLAAAVVELAEGEHKTGVVVTR